MAIANSTDVFGLTDYIVDPTPGRGTFTTIQSAINAAGLIGSGVTVVIKPGTYTENLTFLDGVNLQTINPAVGSGSITILGSHTYSGASASTINISGLTFTDNGASPTFTVADAVGSPGIQFTNCQIENAVGTGIICGQNSDVRLEHCGVSGQTVGVSVVSNGNFGSDRSNLSTNTTYAVTFSSAQTFLLFQNEIDGAIQINDAGAQVFSLNNLQLQVNSIVDFTAAGQIVCLNCLAIVAGPTITNGAGTFTYGNLALPFGSFDFDPATTQDVIPTRPLATTTVPGLAFFDSADFTVSTAGQVSLSGTGNVAWQLQGASATLAVNKGYICNAGAALALLLPATSALGDIIEITLNGATSWSVTQAAGQQIRVANATTTLGAGGSLTSTAQGDSIRMVCQTANTIWVVLSSEGTLTVV